MSLLGRTVMRLAPVVLESLPKAPQISNSLAGTRVLARNFNCLSTTSAIIFNRRNSLQATCSCGCNGRHFQTQGGKELVDFLKDEIAEEKKNVAKAIPAKLDDFEVKVDKAQVTLTRDFKGEKITISIDVNHTVDAESPTMMTPDAQDAEFKSRPAFEVDVKVGSRVLSFTCSFMSPEDSEGQDQDAVRDLFGINEVTIYDGEWSDEVYCVSGDILDVNLYDLLMNYLEERGVSDQFAERISDLCSDYEHSLYVGLLEKLKDFVSK